MKYTLACKQCDAEDLDAEGCGTYRCRACGTAGELGNAVYLKMEEYSDG